MKAIQFNREHLNLIVAREYERDNLIPHLGEQFFSLAERLPYCYSLVADGRIVACIGSFPLWDGVFEAWQIPSVYVKNYILEYCETVRGILDGAAKRERVWRIQTASPADELHDRWMKFIGFECEGTLKEYSRLKADFRLWARRYDGC
jgi:hypothetical protein